MKSYKDFQASAEQAMNEMSEAMTKCADELVEADKRMVSAKRSLHDGIVGKVAYERILSEQNARKQQAKDDLGAVTKKALKAVSDTADEAFTPDLAGLTQDAANVFARVAMTEADLKQIIATSRENYTIVRACITQGKRNGIDCADNAPILRKKIMETVQTFATYCNSAVNERGGEDYRAAWGQIVVKHLESIGKAVADYEAAAWITEEQARYCA